MKNILTCTLIMMYILVIISIIDITAISKFEVNLSDNNKIIDKLKELSEKENIKTYTYIKSENDDLLYMDESIGYGITTLAGNWILMIEEETNNINPYFLGRT